MRYLGGRVITAFDNSGRLITCNCGKQCKICLLVYKLVLDLFMFQDAMNHEENIITYRFLEVINVVIIIYNIQVEKLKLNKK